MPNKSWALAAARLVFGFSDFGPPSPKVMKGGGLMTTVWVCSLSGTPGAATSDTVAMVGRAGSGGVGRTAPLGAGFDSDAGLSSFGAGSETCGAEFTSNMDDLKT